MPDVVDDGGVIESPLTEAAQIAPGTGNHLLVRPVSSALLWLALPVLAEQFLHLFVGLTDTFLAGTISKEATVAIGLATQVGWLAGLLFSFAGSGATALVSRYAGMNTMREANHFANQALASAVILGLLASIVTLWAVPILPRILGWNPVATSITVNFIRIDAWGYVFSSVVVIAAASWRGAGDTRTPLYVRCVVNVLNMFLSAALRFGWGPFPLVGVNGIAIGTLTARILGCTIVIGLLIQGRSGLRLWVSDLRFRYESMARLLRVGIPAGVDGMMLWAGQFAFLGIISRLATGEDQAATVAAHVVGIRIEALSYLPAYAWATAAATMVGQSLGAGQPQRALRSGHLAALQGAGLCLTMGICYFIFAGPIYAFLNSSTDQTRVMALGVPALRLLAFFQIPLGLMIIYPNALRGAGDSRYPMIFTLVSMIGLRLPIAYICGIVLQGGLVGAWVGMCVDMSVRAFLNGIRFTRGKWVTIQV